MSDPVYANSVTKVSVSDIDDPSTELALIDDETADWISAETAAAYTLYEHTDDSYSVDIPYAVAGLTGYWIARGGSYVYDGSSAYKKAAIAPLSVTIGNLILWSSTANELEDGPAVTTSVGDPGNDDQVPTEQAVREALDAKDAPLTVNMTSGTTFAATTGVQDEVVLLTSTGVRNLTDITGGSGGMRKLLMFNDGNITVIHGASTIVLVGAEDVNFSSGDNLCIAHDGTRWREVSRALF